MSFRRPTMGETPTTVLFLLLAAIWGSSFVAIKIGIADVPALSFAAIRYSIAGLIVLAYAAHTTDRWRPRGRREWVLAATVGLFVIGIYHGALYLGEHDVSAPIAAIVISLAPILTAGFASKLHENVTIDGTQAAGLLAGLAGVVIVANPGSAGSVDLGGLLLVFLAAASFALGGVLTGKLPGGGGLPVETMEAWAMLIGSLALWVGAAVRGENVTAVHWTPTALASLAYLTLVCGAGGFLLYFVLLERAGATEINLVSYLEPIGASVVAWALFGDVVSPRALAGFAVIFAGFALVKHRYIGAAVRNTTDDAEL
ncbi:MULTISPECIES: DMT family transporter [Halobacterium]|uniref:DMT family transporter n=1 Tax=Halobacterium TaxID=2239 RepID=UPI0019668E0F|nr:MULTISPECIES: DMT family transporter [Halobacterium]MCF2165191.1 DMT family transporter [Halobacterium salinarum]MCF2168000.1 DMT family transporter [Halobacterium salinarum]MCF2238678.1 DMT family transporter [Halobacterium salinarum]MDL0122979.1 DMT family transporter [Halobacterium salinarum]MDL0124845.1 DMT family transporter [Halobacterium salinarum]